MDSLYSTISGLTNVISGLVERYNGINQVFSGGATGQCLAKGVNGRVFWQSVSRLSFEGFNQALRPVQLDGNGKIPFGLYGTNKEKVLVGEPTSGVLEIVYDPNYDIFLNQVQLSSNILDIGKVDFSQSSLSTNQSVTFQSWLKFSNSQNAQTISIDSDITVVGFIPNILSGSFIHVFVRRAFKDDNDVIHEAISYSYSF